jgi:hypothetical protein
LAQQRRFENVSRTLLRTMRLKLVNAWIAVFKVISIVKMPPQQTDNKCCKDQLARYKRLRKLQNAYEMDSWTIMRVQVKDQVIFSETEDEGKSGGRRTRPHTPVMPVTSDPVNSNNAVLSDKAVPLDENDVAGPSVQVDDSVLLLKEDEKPLAHHPLTWRAKLQGGSALCLLL